MLYQTTKPNKVEYAFLSNKQVPKLIRRSHDFAYEKQSRINFISRFHVVTKNIYFNYFIIIISMRLELR